VNNWVSALLGGSFGGGVLGAIVVLARLYANRGIVKATTEQLKAAAADRLSDTAAEMVRQIREDARAEIARARVEVTQARDEAVQARQEASEARREATEARREAMDANREFRRLKTAILSPYATVERLRELVGDPGSNGTAAAVAPH